MGLCWDREGVGGGSVWLGRGELLLSCEQCGHLRK